MGILRFVLFFLLLVFVCGVFFLFFLFSFSVCACVCVCMHACVCACMHVSFLLFLSGDGGRWVGGGLSVFFCLFQVVVFFLNRIVNLFGHCIS